MTIIENGSGIYQPDGNNGPELFPLILEPADPGAYLLNLISTTVAELSTTEEANKVRRVLEPAFFYVMNSDGWYETGSQDSHKKAINERNKFISQMVNAIGLTHPIRLWKASKSIRQREKRLRSFYLFEDYLRQKIKDGSTFTEGEIQRYIRRKSLDAYAYGRIIRAIVPQWNLTCELHAEIMLYDMKKDLEDYQGDLQIEKPNLLYFYLVNSVGKQQLPTQNARVLVVARETGDAHRILKRAEAIRDQALSSGRLNGHLLLNNDINGLYQDLELKLQSLVVS